MVSEKNAFPGEKKKKCEIEKNGFESWWHKSTIQAKQKISKCLYMFQLLLTVCSGDKWACFCVLL